MSYYENSPHVGLRFLFIYQTSCEVKEFMKPKNSKSCCASKKNSFFNGIASYATILRFASPTLAAYDILRHLFI